MFSATRLQSCIKSKLSSPKQSGGTNVNFTPFLNARYCSHSKKRAPGHWGMQALRRVRYGKEMEVELDTSRRMIVRLAAATILLTRPAYGEDELATFENAKQNYRLQRPREWEQVSKAGADALFKATNAKSTDIGVTVNAIKIRQLEQLGDVKAAGERLVAAERKKESTKSIDMLQQTTSVGQSGTEFYNFDYTISTTRGDKRIVSKVGVANSNLYIVNGSIKCEGEKCKEATPLLGLVKKSVESFDIITA